MDLETRIKRLERANGILKYGGLLVVAVVLFSAFVPQDQVQEVVRANRFELRDTDGRLAAVLRLADTSKVNSFGAKSTPGAALEIFGVGDRSVVALNGGQDRAGLVLSYERQLFTARPAGLFWVHGVTGAVVQLNAVDGKMFLSLADRSGKAVLGSTTTVNERTGAETIFPVSTLTLYDGEGNIRHQVPR